MVLLVQIGKWCGVAGKKFWLLSKMAALECQAYMLSIMLSYLNGFGDF